MTETKAPQPIAMGRILPKPNIIRDFVPISDPALKVLDEQRQTLDDTKPRAPPSPIPSPKSTPIPEPRPTSPTVQGDPNMHLIFDQKPLPLPDQPHMLPPQESWPSNQANSLPLEEGQTMSVGCESKAVSLHAPKTYLSPVEQILQQVESSELILEHVLSQFALRDLEEACRRLKIDTKGRKAVLIERIRKHQKDNLGMQM
jgi:hypothetical protein